MLFSTNLCGSTATFCKNLTSILHFCSILPYLYRNSPHKQISADNAEKNRSRIYRGAYRRSLVILACVEVAGETDAAAGRYKAYCRYNRKNNIVAEVGSVFPEAGLSKLYKQGKGRAEKNIQEQGGGCRKNQGAGPR